MPWCPECGAEYREGVVRCAKCNVGLQEQPPRPSEDQPAVSRRLLLGFARELRSQAVRAFGYARGGLALFWRHPSLLVVPLLLTLLGFSDFAVGQYARARHRAQQEGMVGTQRHSTPVHIPVGPIIKSRLLNPRRMIAVSQFMVPLHDVMLQGTAQALTLWQQEERPSGDDRERSPVDPALVLALLLAGLAVSSLALGGFFGMASRVVEEGTLTWAGFGVNARRLWLRFLLFQAGASLVFGWPYLWDRIVGGSYLFAKLSQVWGTWVVPIAGFFAALTWYSIVTENAALWRALGRSVQTVGRHLATALCLLLALSFVRFVLLLPVEVGDALLITKYASYHDDVTFIALPAFFVRESLKAIIGVWFCLVAFLWYRDARPRTATASAAE